MEHVPLAPPRPADRLARLADRRWTMPALFALALGVRIGFMLAWPQTPFSDGEWYLTRAAELARGMGYQEAGHPTAFWPVGYPALLGGAIRLVGGGALASALINLASAAATLALILWFARAVGAGRVGAVVAGLFYALYPSPIVYAGAPLSEASSTAVAMAAFALLIAGRNRWPLLAAAGLLFGAGTLMRAQLMFFPAGALVALMLVDPRFGWREAARAALVVHLVLAAVVLPWTIRNERVLGAPVLVSTNGGMSLYTGASEEATGDWYPWEHTAIWDRAGIPFSQRVERQVELDRRFKALATGWIAAHPLRWTALGFKKAALVWRKDTDAFWSMEESYPDQARLWTAVTVADQLYYFALLALAVPALAMGLAGVAKRDGDWARPALLGCMPAFITLTAFAFTGQIRYHYSAMPFVIVAAGWTVSRLGAAVLNRRSGSGRPAASPTARSRWNRTDRA